MMGKRATVRASTLRPRPLEEKALTARALERHVLPLFERGALRVPVAATYPLDAVAEAYERFTAGGKLGKIVLEPVVNAAERLWRGLARRDWEAVRAQFHPSAVVERAGAGRARTSTSTSRRTASRPRAARARSRCCARSWTARRRSSRRAWATRRCAGIYDLHDGRIAGAVEYWA